MRKYTRRRRPFARSARSLTDSRQFNLCGQDLVLTGDSEDPVNNCAQPYQQWISIVYPALEPSASSSVAVNKGQRFSSARFKYKYTLRNPEGSTSGFFNTLHIRSALVLSPQSNGSPLPDPVTGNLPLLFNSDGDLPQGLRILWRSLDILSNEEQFPGNHTFQANTYNAYIPLERFNGRVNVREGQGLYWVSEVVSGNPALNAHLVLDCTMAYRLGNI